MKVTIATPFYNMQGWSNYILSLAKTLLIVPQVTKVQLDFMQIAGDSYIERARNSIAHLFMKSDATHLAFIDSDMGWEPEGLLRLIAADVPFVGAGFPCKNNWGFYGCRLHCDSEGVAITNDKGLISTWNVPTGFCLIKREVFTRLAEAFPDHTYIYQMPDEKEPSPYSDFFGHYFRKGDDYRDDVYFCRKWASIGGEIWVEPRITLRHAGFEEHVGNLHEFLLACPGGSNDPAREGR